MDTVKRVGVIEDEPQFVQWLEKALGEIGGCKIFFSAGTFSHWRCMALLPPKMHQSTAFKKYTLTSGAHILVLEWLSHCIKVAL